MPFQYSCFISYRRGHHELTRRFIEELVGALKSHVEPWLDEEVYIDEDGLRGGAFIDEGIAHALCKSVCMILIFTPKYFDRKRTYCAREYMAMKRLEEKRLRLLKDLADRKAGLIIPVVFRGPEHLPSEIKRRLYYDFSAYTLVRPEISNNPQYVEAIEEIARRIREIYDHFRGLPQDPCGACKDFALPAEEEIQEWLEGVVAPRSPFPWA